MRVTALAPAVLALLLAGCGGSRATPGPPADAKPAAEQHVAQRDALTTRARQREQAAQRVAGLTADSLHTAAADAARTGARVRSRGDTDGTRPRQEPDGPAPAGAAAPAPAQHQAKPPADFDVTGTVNPACVRPGGSITLTVTALPGAGIAYNAMYADAESGAAPPYGAGYGGNAGGIADAAGRYSDSWTVAATAPAGSGLVEVIAGSGGIYRQTTVPFAVADAVTGACAP